MPRDMSFGPVICLQGPTTAEILIIWGLKYRPCWSIVYGSYGIVAQGDLRVLFRPWKLGERPKIYAPLEIIEVFASALVHAMVIGNQQSCRFREPTWKVPKISKISATTTSTAEPLVTVLSFYANMIALRGKSAASVPVSFSKPVREQRLILRSGEAPLHVWRLLFKFSDSEATRW
jgi:hypothetical protein